MHADAGRGAATAAAVLALSVSGHVLGGGALPDPVALLLVGVVALALSAVLSVASRPPRVAVLAGVVTVFQVVAHTVFHSVAGVGPVSAATLVGHAHGAGLPGAALTSTHVHAAASLGSVHTLSSVHTLTPVHTLTSAHAVSPLMVTTHLLATVLLAWLIGPAVEQARGVVRRVLTPLPRIERRLSQPAVPLVVSWVSRTTGSTVSLRGPPARFASI